MQVATPPPEGAAPEGAGTVATRAATLPPRAQELADQLTRQARRDAADAAHAVALARERLESATVESRTTMEVPVLRLDAETSATAVREAADRYATTPAPRPTCRRRG